MDKWFVPVAADCSSTLNGASAGGTTTTTSQLVGDLVVPLIRAALRPVCTSGADVFEWLITLADSSLVELHRSLRENTRAW